MSTAKAMPLENHTGCIEEGVDLMSPTNGKQMKAATRVGLDPREDRLDSWKELAVYLGREVRTVQRWEKSEGLPVRRHDHAKASSVYAFKREIDAWLQSRSQSPRQLAGSEECAELEAESPKQISVPASRVPAKLRFRLQSAVAGVGSLDLLQGEERIRLYFYVQVPSEREAGVDLKNNNSNQGRQLNSQNACRGVETYKAQQPTAPPRSAKPRHRFRNRLVTPTEC